MWGRGLAKMLCEKKLSNFDLGRLSTLPGLDLIFGEIKSRFYYSEKTILSNIQIHQKSSTDFFCST